MVNLLLYFPSFSKEQSSKPSPKQTNETRGVALAKQEEAQAVNAQIIGFSVEGLAFKNNVFGTTVAYIILEF